MVHFTLATGSGQEPSISSSPSRILVALLCHGRDGCVLVGICERERARMYTHLGVAGTCQLGSSLCRDKEGADLLPCGARAFCGRTIAWLQIHSVNIMAANVCAPSLCLSFLPQDRFLGVGLLLSTLFPKNLLFQQVLLISEPLVAVLIETTTSAVSTRHSPAHQCTPIEHVKVGLSFIYLLRIFWIT